MYEGSITGNIVRFAVPLFVGNLFQQLYNTADALIVGNMLGNSALAAVSCTGSLIYMLVGFVEGIFMGAGVAVSRYFGAGDGDRLHRAIHTDAAFCLVAGALMTAAGVFFSDDLLRLMGTPSDIAGAAAEYLRIYFSGSLAMMVYNCCRGIMQAVGDSRHPLFYLVLSSVINVILDILFIAVFHGGVGSAALATIISQGISAVLCVVRLVRTKEPHRIIPKQIAFDGEMLKQVISYGLPSGFQNSAIAIANVLVQSNVNAFGTMAVAGLGAYSKIEGFVFLPISSFVMALTTFIGQNLGAGQLKRARKGAAFGVGCSVLIAEMIGVAVFFSMPVLIKLFTTEAEAMAFGIEKARSCSLFFCFLAATHAMAGVLRGAGKSFFPMMTYFCVWGIGRVGYLTLASERITEIFQVNIVYPVTWIISTVVLCVYYFKADWIHGFSVRD